MNDFYKTNFKKYEKYSALNREHVIKSTDCIILFNREQGAQESDTTKAQSGTKAKYKK